MPRFHEAAVIEANALRGLGRLGEAEALLRATVQLAQTPDEGTQAETETGGERATHRAATLRTVADEAIAQRLRFERAGSNRQGLYYASRGLGDLLEADGRASEAMAFLMPVLAMTPNDAGLTRQLLSLARASHHQQAVEVFEGHMQRLRALAVGAQEGPAESPGDVKRPPPSHEDVPPHGVAGSIGTELRGKAERPAEDLRATVAATAPRARPAPSASRGRSKWSGRLATSRQSAEKVSI